LVDSGCFIKSESRAERDAESSASAPVKSERTTGEKERKFMVTVSKEGRAMLETTEIIQSKELGLGEFRNIKLKKILRREIFWDRSICGTDKNY
jgi:hypothetical protein